MRLSSTALVEQFEYDNKNFITNGPRGIQLAVLVNKGGGLFLVKAGHSALFPVSPFEAATAIAGAWEKNGTTQRLRGHRRYYPLPRFACRSDQIHHAKDHDERGREVKTKKPQKKVKAETKSHPIPEWMDPDVKAKAEKLDILQRIELAAKLEKAALELREMKPAKVEASFFVSLFIRPNMKKLLIEFYERHGGDKEVKEESKVAIGIRWFLEGALPDVAAVSERTCRQVHYRDAEALEESHYTEQLIGAAFESWKRPTREETEEEEN